MSGLRFIERGSFIPGVPARDLSDHDIDRLVYVRTVGTLKDQDRGLYPKDKGFAKARSSVVESLTASGLYEVAEDAPAQDEPAVEPEAPPADPEPTAPEEN